MSNLFNLSTSDYLFCWIGQLTTFNLQHASKSPHQDPNKRAYQPTGSSPGTPLWGNSWLVDNSEECVGDSVDELDYFLQSDILSQSPMKQGNCKSVRDRACPKKPNTHSKGDEGPGAAH